MADYRILDVAKYPVRRRFLRLFRHDTVQEEDAAKAAWDRYWRQPSPRITCELSKSRELPKHINILAYQLYRVFCEGVMLFVLYKYREKFLALANIVLTFGSPDERRFVELELRKDGSIEVHDSEGEGPYPFSYPTSLGVSAYYTYPPARTDPWKQDPWRKRDNFFNSSDELFGGGEFIDPFLDYLEREGERRIHHRCKASAEDDQYDGDVWIKLETQFQRLP